MLGKSQNFIELLSSSPPKMKILSVLAKISRKTEIGNSVRALFQMKTRVYLKYFVKD